jgi:CRISPR-associated protein Cas1
MQLYLDSYGSFLGLKDNSFWLKTKSQEGKLLPLRKLKAIMASKGVTISTDAILLALKENIPIIFIDALGRSEGYIWTGQFGSISSIRKKQALFSNHQEGMRWIASILQERLLQQIAHLENYQFVDKAKSIKALNKQLQKWERLRWKKRENLEQLAASFRGMEGTASRIYFQAIAQIIPAFWDFKKRVKRPAYDPFNAMLNYLYGMLYPMVEISLIKAGLDPYMGVLHIDRHKRPTLVFDCIEIYRHWAEQVAVELALMPQMQLHEYFGEPSPIEGVRLLPAGKSLLIPQMLNFLEQKAAYKGQLRKRTTHIDLDMQYLASHIRQFEESYLGQR